MFAVPRKIITNFTIIAGLLLSGLAQADATDTCFNFLNAQDYSRAESEAKTLVKRKGLSREDRRYAYVCLGRTLANQGREQDSLAAYQQVEKLSQTTKELQAAYSVLGSIYGKLEDYDQAELYDQRAIMLARQLGDKSGEAASLNSWALVVQSRGDENRALVLFQESLALESDEAAKTMTLNNIAGVYANRNEYDKAVNTVRQAREIGQRNGNAHEAAIFQINIGGLLVRSGKFDEAEVELMAGLSAIRLVGDKGWEANVCKNLAWLGEAKQDTRAAKEWYAKAEKIYREIGQAAKADQMAADAAALGK